jgi:hypothetical protein
MGTLSDYEIITNNKFSAKEQYKGIIPRVIEAICNRVNSEINTSICTDYDIKMSLVEI